MKTYSFACHLYFLMCIIIYVYDICQGIRMSEASDTLDLESKAVVMHDVGVGTHIQVLCKTVCGFISNKH